MVRGVRSHEPQHRTPTGCMPFHHLYLRPRSSPSLPLHPRTTRVLLYSYYSTSSNSTLLPRPTCSSSACRKTVSASCRQACINQPNPSHHSNALHSRRKLSKLMPDHILRNGHIMIHLPVVDLELQPHKVREDRRRSSLGSDGRLFLAGAWTGEREAGLVSQDGLGQW